MAVDVTVETPDRHHKLEILTPVGLTNPKQEIDLIAKPFNRDSTYTIKINFTYAEVPGVLTLGSELPVRFVENRRASSDYNDWISSRGVARINKRWCARDTHKDEIDYLPCRLHLDSPAFRHSVNMNVLLWLRFA